MKLLAVVGSMRDGNTKHLVDEMIYSISAIEDVITEEIHLAELRIGFCNGCLACDVTKECVIDDDMVHIVQKAREADAFILASPARWGLLSGEMKTFMDRLNPLAVTEELNGKKCIVLAVGQSEESEKDSIVNAANSISTFCESAGIEVVEKLIVCNCYGKDAWETNYDAIGSCKRAVSHLIDSFLS